MMICMTAYCCTYSEERVICSAQLNNTSPTTDLFRMCTITISCRSTTRSVSDVQNTSCTLNLEAASLSPAAAGITGTLVGSSQPLLPRAPAASLSNNRSSRSSEPRASVVPVAEPAASTTTACGGETAALTFDKLLVRCTAMLGVPGGVQARESLRRVLKIWSEGGNMNDCVQDQVSIYFVRVYL